VSFPFLSTRSWSSEPHKENSAGSGKKSSRAPSFGGGQAAGSATAQTQADSPVTGRRITCLGRNQYSVPAPLNNHLQFCLLIQVQAPGRDLKPKDYKSYKELIEEMKLPVKNIIKITETGKSPSSFYCIVPAVRK
jgi:hypothetical protein